jgi:hypothetical protein
LERLEPATAVQQRREIRPPGRGRGETRRGHAKRPAPGFAGTVAVFRSPPDDATPSIGHFAITVAPFDRGALETRLRELGTRVLPAADEPDVVRFADNNGIIVEVRVAR